jgi:hypothetical protein
MVTNADTITIWGTTNGTSVTIDDIPATLSHGNFTAVEPLIEGPNLIFIVAHDAGGNTTTTWFTILRDSIPPVVAITSPIFPLQTNRTSIHVEGIVERECKVEINGKAVNVTADTFSADVQMNRNITMVEVKATDRAHNIRQVDYPVTYDDQLNLTVTTRFDHDYHLNATESKDLIETYYDRIYIEGKTDPGANVTVNGNPIKVSANGSFMTYVDLKLGKNNISIAVTDEAGNNLTGYLDVKRYFWEPFVVPVEMAGTLLILGLIFGTVGGYYYGRHNERKAQALKRTKAEEAARAAQRAQRPPKAPAPPKPKAEMPETPENI